MGRHISFKVKESCEELRTLIRKETNPKNVLRLQSLVHIKENTFVKQVELAAHLGYNIRTMELWLEKYKEGGIDNMLISCNNRQAKKRCVSQEIHDGLSERLHDSYKGFDSYVHAVNWVNETYNVKFPYNTLREYMIDMFGTKIKQPRKSHVKKDEEAQADFLKLT